MNSISSFFSAASNVLKFILKIYTPETSAWTEWSITKSTGTKGLIFRGSPFRSAIAFLIVAKSTKQGTPVKSYKRTLAGLNGISILLAYYFSQSKILLISYFLI